MATFPLTSQVLTSNNIEARDVTINTTISPQRDPMQILQEHVAIGALYNSNERFDPPKCHPQTRTAILDRIKQWAADSSEDAKPVLWLSGPAGAGKSAIAQTLVETWKEMGILFIAFFFWRTSSQRNQKTRLVPTIALQLLELFPSTRPQIEAAISTIGFFERSLLFQLEKLVIEPLCAMSEERQTVIVVIDGLDECCIDLPKTEDFPGQGYESQQREILEALTTASLKLSWVRFLMVSRPEKQMRESFGRGSLKEQTFPLSLKDVSNADADIRLFLDYKFEEIRHRYGIGASWPTKAQLDELLRKSSGQFIYPSVAIKHITRAGANPIQSLQDVLELQPGSAHKPLAELDMLYTLVLKSVSTQSLPVVTDILRYILRDVTDDNFCNVREIFAQMPTKNSARMFERFLFLPEGGVNFHLADLHSVMDIPTDPQHGISLIHATFSEYLQDQTRSGYFFISSDHTPLCFAQLSVKHIQALDSQITRLDEYNAAYLFACPCAWINYSCPPSEELARYLWSLMRTEIGEYPFSTGHTTINPLPLASKELSNQFVSELKELKKGNTDWRCKIIQYLQRCNIPEIEPSWWRRFRIRRSLKTALKRISEEQEPDDGD